MASIYPTTVPSKRLAASINAASSSFQLNDILGWDGNALTSADFGSKAYGVFRNDDNTLMEIFEFDPTTIASASITILLRGLKFTGDLTTEVTANKLTWVKNETIVELGTDVPQLLKQMVDALSDQSVAGVKTFSSFPQKSGVTTPTAAAELATKAYVDATATGAAAIYDQQMFAGTAGETLVAGDLCYFKTSDQRWWKADADASATSLVVQLGFAQAAATAGNAVNILTRGTEKNLTGLTAGSSYYVSGTAGGVSLTKGTFSRFIGVASSTTRLIFCPDSDPENVKQDGQVLYAADSVGTDAYAITLVPAITAYVAGMSFLFKAGTANTGGATLAVSGLAAKTILKNNDQALSDNDIESGQIVHVVYDGTNFQMISQTAKAVVQKFGGDGSDGALSITSGTTTIDCANAAVVIKNYTSISITGTGALAFSNPATKGTLIILKSQGNVVITTSATRAIDLRSLGGTGGAGGASTAAGTTGTDSDYYADTLTHAGTGATADSGGAGAAGAAVAQGLGLYMSSSTHISMRATILCPGSGGGGGGGGRPATGAAGGAGGRGAGSLYIECAGAYNCTGTIDATGAVGTDGTAATGGQTGGGGGGGGGSGGAIVVIYNSLTADSGTYTVTGGAGGSGGAGTSNDGGDGGGGGGIHETAGTVGGSSAGIAGAAGGAGANGFSVRMVNPTLV